MAPGTPPAFTFVAAGDMGVNPTAAANVARMAEANPDFALHAGDLAYSGGDPVKWDAFMQQVAPLNDRGQYWPAIGNHEYEGGLSLYADRFSLPNNERWYSFNHSNVHVVSLDGGPTYDAVPMGETEWLEADLGYNAQDPLHPWTIVELHYPLFTTGPHGSWLGGRSLWGSLFDRSGVELVIQGHDHMYERSWPVLASGGVTQQSYDSPGAPVYVTTGGGGAPLYLPVLDAPWSAFRASSYETLRVTVDGGQMAIAAIRPDGTILDSFTLTSSALQVSFQIRQGKSPLEVVFSSGVSLGTPPYRYAWDFGDGKGSDQPNPTHAYALPGRYIATLTITDAQGLWGARSAAVRVGLTSSSLSTWVPWIVALAVAAVTLTALLRRAMREAAPPGSGAKEGDFPPRTPP